ncbi:hypothetical protein P7C70_g6127, partial [Phenoliferia sp. Uapishka_3]
MASRKSKDLPPASTDIGALTTDLRAQLRTYISFASTVNAQLKDVNQLHSELDDDNKPLTIVKGRLDRAYDEVGREAEEEIRRIDKAVQTLDMLLAMQAEAEAASHAMSPPLPVAAGNQAVASKSRGPYKRKIRTDSAAGSPAPSAAPSPMSQASPANSYTSLPRSGSSKGLPTQAFA